MNSTITAASQREQLLDLASSVSRDAEIIESRRTVTAEDAVCALGLELRAIRLTLAAVIAPHEPPRDEKPAIEEGWYEISLMGHRERWAHIRTVVFAGRQFVEIATPSYPKEPPPNSGDDSPGMEPARVEYYSPAAIFSLAPSTEADVLEELQQRSSYPF